jgi:hypothetical protein
MLLPLRSARSVPIGLLALLVAFAAEPVRAGLHQYEITGTIDGSSVFDATTGTFFPTGPIPFGTTVPFTLRFILDDTVPATSTGPGFNVYDDAIAAVEMEIDAQPDVVIATRGSVTGTVGTSFHTWAPGAFRSAVGFAHSIPGFDVEDGGTGLLRVEFSGFEAVLFDSTRSMYLADPPELIAADLADSTQNQMMLNWDDASFSVRMTMGGTIDAITVPEPGLATSLGAGLSALLVATGLRRRG